MKNFIFFFLIGGFLTAQDLTGHWVIVGNMDDGYYAELNLVQNQENKYAGHSYDTESGGFCRHWLDANFYPGSKKLKGRDVELIDKTPDHEATDYNLMYYVKDGKEFLMGTQTITPLQNNDMFSMPFDMFYGSGSTSMVVYMKVSDKYEPHVPGMPNAMTEEEIKLEKSEYPEINKHKDLIPDPPEILTPEDTEDATIVETPHEVEKENVEKDSLESNKVLKQRVEHKKEHRNNKLLSYITLQDVKEIDLLIKDYGEEDNDTISIFFNDELIAHHIRLSHEAKVYKLKLKPGQINELVFVANNLGDVPPNTARLTILANDKRYNYKLFTDEKNNALIKIENQ